ncbi:hypothetical protein B7P43_G07898 [Cryptotermes secundus]|uniref:Protein takeout n=1 Tax=Cryptotermes secundus TaxID=105785 RepID=A0A2J7QTG8_9NEOP|nr:protein takeout [Cryptotermes secundus]PNF31882.1 hypothetical protein B7P43_G07898 [Cryptotermes secundus]
MLAVSWIVVSFAAAALAVRPLPPYIKPCARSDPKFNDCTLQHGNEAIPYIVKGDSSYDITNVDPMAIKVIDVKNGPKQAGLHLTLRDVKLHGLRTAVLLKSDFNFKKRHFSHDFSIPLLKLLGKYTISGRLLLLPIHGNGDINVTMVNNIVTYSYDWVLEQKGEYKHLLLKDPVAVIKPSKAYIHLSNLFDGDRFMGERLNEIINDNWQDLFRDMAPKIAHEIAVVISSIVNNIAKDVPYDVIFPERLP